MYAIFSSYYKHAETDVKLVNEKNIRKYCLEQLINNLEDIIHFYSHDSSYDDDSELEFSSGEENDSESDNEAKFKEKIAKLKSKKISNYQTILLNAEKELKLINKKKTAKPFNTNEELIEAVLDCGEIMVTKEIGWGILHIVYGKDMEKL
jgi:hypothetical protein